jgi:chemotaxis protein MotB
MQAAKQPIIVIKKKAAGHERHGGAWKVAYADFVTAMMALFIVLWLMNSSEKLRKTIGGYFQDPRGNGKQTGTNRGGSGEGLIVKKDDMLKLKDRLQQAMKKMQDFSQIHQQVQMTITAEGLRIELLETKGGFFFENGSPVATPQGKELLSSLAQEIGQLPNTLLIEGHTDSAPYAGRSDYSNWELSSDRANSARRTMEAAGLRADQTGYVRGMADRKLKDRANPFDPANRRISLIIQYQDADSGEINSQPASPTGNLKIATNVQPHVPGRKP